MTPIIDILSNIPFFCEMPRAPRKPKVENPPPQRSNCPRRGLPVAHEAVHVFESETPPPPNSTSSEGGRTIEGGSIVIDIEPTQHAPVLYTTQSEKEKYLDELKTTIESLDVSHHVEILQKLQDYPSNTVERTGGGVKINENRNGVYINLSYLPDPLIRELTETVKYIKNQESILNIDEMSKDHFKRAYFAVQTT